MIEVIGKENRALCFCDELEAGAEEQIKAVCDRIEFADSKIRIMPDVHAGMGCTIGTTMTIHDKIVPGMVGVDIGCGMETVEIAERSVDFTQLDQEIRRGIPSGFNIRKKEHALNGEIDLKELRCVSAVSLDRARLSIGTLGGGNHFIEMGRDDSDRLYLVVHSGSRNLGKQVAEYYQKLAVKQRKEESGARTETPLPKDLTYLSGGLFEDYLHDMRIVQKYASLNREAMVRTLVRAMDWTITDRFTTIHNYIDTDEMMLRKGAVSAKAGERLLIPMNMRDGSLVCVGKGNPDWNSSAPHGAGRLLSRKAAQAQLSMAAYQDAMKDVFTTCVSKATLDEAPMAYKPMEAILDQIGATVDIVKRIRPAYNFKAAER